MWERYPRQFLVGVVLFLFPLISWGQKTGTLNGKVIDEVTGEALAFATVFVEGSNLGVTSNANGEYRLFNVPTGEQTIVCSYLGYEKAQVELTIGEGENSHSFRLSPVGVSAEEVIISAQLKGQRAAINQQLNSNTIVNVISKEKIQELPDQNAAESLGRLPGIAVLRDAGEGTKVVVRGLSPRFNSITVNGVRVPSTDPEDRSVDLTMVSTDALEGIEVFKALTPDKDGDAVGGTINFVVKKAAEGFQGSVRLLSGYNNHEEEFGQWRGNFNLSNRFFNNKLGVILTGNYQRVNRSSDLLEAGYVQDGINNNGQSILTINNLNLADRQEVRYRYGGSLSLDYQLDRGFLLLSSFLGSTDREEVRRRRRYRVGASYQERDLRDREINTLLHSHSLSGEYTFNFLNLQLSWLTSYSQTTRETPYSHFARFRELGAFTGDLIEDQGPEFIPAGAKNDLDETHFHDATLNFDDIVDENMTAQIDLKVPFDLGKPFNGYFKAGAKIRDKSRVRDLTQIWTAFGGIPAIIRDHGSEFQLDARNRISIYNFLGSFDPGSFLQGRYEFGPTLDLDLLNQFPETYRDYYTVDQETDLRDYGADETVQSGYVMGEFHFLDKRLMLLSGVRVEQTENAYSSVFGTPLTGGFVSGLRDTTGTNTYTEILPMIHLRYKFTPWFDVRLATTKSLSRPNYFNLVPWQRINHFEGIVEEGAPDLRHTQVWNYDVFLSFYSKYTLFTLGGFYKEITDIDYVRTSRISEQGPTLGYDYVRPVNAIADANAYGIEIDLQTNFKFLPKPFNGILLSANYSLVKAETFYPFFQVGPERSPEPPFRPVVTDTLRAGRVPGQAEHIFNVSLGYEHKGFSGRLSVVYQSESLGTVGRRAEQDGFTDSFQRWDLSIQQKIGKTGLAVMANLNNISNTPQRTFVAIGFPTREEFFGWTGDLGVKYNF